MHRRIDAAPTAPVDDLVNVTVQPCHFADATAALALGHHICDSIGPGDAYPAVVSDVMSNLATTEEYQAEYLINQAAEEMCPALIRQLRSGAANYRPAPSPPQ